MYLQVWTVLSLPALTFEFTLDAQAPVVKRGNPGSYFGYTVAQHSPKIQKGRKFIPWILVGAPLDQNLQPDTEKSGAVFRCPVTYLVDDCIQIPLDGKVKGSDQLEPPGRNEWKKNQWLGVTLSSQGEKVLTCAHRYIQDTEYWFGQGLCYTLSQALEIDEIWTPCFGMPTKRPLEEFGYCQAGTSGWMVGNRTVVGGPGSYTARGSAFLFDTSDDFLRRDNVVYYLPLNQPATPTGADLLDIDNYSYLGMSVTGFMDSAGDQVLLAGAPRALEGRGAILIFRQDKFPPNLIAFNIIRGEQPFSNFGYQMALADINGDKRPDLIVGAPEYFDPIKDDTGGAIYVYLNHGPPSYFNDNERIQLTGTNGSRYGLAVSRAGDLNKDGYEDFAVGAPYDGDGKVFVYLGSKSGEIAPHKELVQELLGRRYNMLTLGSSISGGWDMDGNGIPDLLVGAFESSAVLLFRGRTLTSLEVKVGPEEALKDIDPESCGGLPSDNPCFRFTVCVTIEANTDRWLYYTLRGDTSKAVPRIYFKTDLGRSSLNEDKLQLKFNETTSMAGTCTNFTVFIKRERRHERVPIDFLLAYTLPDGSADREPGSSSELPSLEPQLDPGKAFSTFQVSLLRNCDPVCATELNLSATCLAPEVLPGVWRVVKGENKEITVIITITNFGDPAYEAKLYVEHTSNVSYIWSNSKTCEYVKNVVVCNLGDPMEKQQSKFYKIRFSVEGIIDTSPFQAFVIKANTTSSLIGPEPIVPMKLQLYKTYHPPTFFAKSIPGQLTFSGEVSEVVEYVDDTGISVEHIFHILNEGTESMGGLQLYIDSPFKTFKSKMEFYIFYVVHNPLIEGAVGRCDFEENTLNPVGLLERNVKDNQNFTNYEENFNQTQDVSGDLQRRKREEVVTEQPVPREVEKSNKNSTSFGKSFKMNCDEGAILCYHFKCSINSLNPNEEAKIILKARIVNSTLRLFSKFKYLHILSRALLTVQPAQDVFTDNKRLNFMAHAETVVLVSRKPSALWVPYVISGALGLLIFFIIVVGLLRCGFFRREKLPPAERAELTTDEMHHLTSH